VGEGGRGRGMRETYLGGREEVGREKMVGIGDG